MKTYYEMIQWAADNESTLRGYYWPAKMAIAEMYGVPFETIHKDLENEQAARAKAKKEQRKAQSQASNEQRRLANLAKVKNVENRRDDRDSFIQSVDIIEDR